MDEVGHFTATLKITTRVTSFGAKPLTAEDLASLLADCVELVQPDDLTSVIEWNIDVKEDSDEKR